MAWRATHLTSATVILTYLMPVGVIQHCPLSEAQWEDASANLPLCDGSLSSQTRVSDLSSQMSGGTPSLNCFTEARQPVPTDAVAGTGDHSWPSSNIFRTHLHFIHYLPLIPKSLLFNHDDTFGHFAHSRNPRTLVRRVQFSAKDYTADDGGG